MSALWGIDTPGTLAVLQSFLQQFPDYPPARDRTYAALIAYADQLAAAGDTQAARQQLQRAHDLMPERSEALVASQVLTPSATPIPLTFTSTLTVRLPSIPTTVPIVAGALATATPQVPALAVVTPVPTPRT